MFIPDQFDPISLPSLPLSQRKDLPKCSGIYFAIDNQGELQHIGRAVNLKARWQAHSKGVELRA